VIFLRRPLPEDRRGKVGTTISSTNRSAIIARAAQFTLHTSLPADADFRPVIEDLAGFPSPSRSHVIQ
jgi:hypothetical protein